VHGTPVSVIDPGYRQNKNSPLDVEGIDLDLSSEEIVDYVHEGQNEHGLHQHNASEESQ
jgi:hypothetical protein